MNELGRVTRAYVSGYQRDRVHRSRLVRGERRHLVANFNGAIPAGRSIVAVVWRVNAASAIYMADPAIEGRSVSVYIHAQAGGEAVLKAEVTLGTGEVYNQLFVIAVLPVPWLDQAAPAAAGPSMVSLVLPGPTIAGTPPPAYAGISYTYAYAVGQGSGGAVVALKGGTLPPSMGVSASGVLSGVPALPGTTPFTLRVSASDGQAASWSGSLVVNPLPWDFTWIGSAAAPGVSKVDWLFAPSLEKFIVLHAAGVEVSADAQTWASYTPTLVSYPASIAWSPKLSLLVVGGESAAMSRSEDGINWTTVAAPAYGKRVIWADGLDRFVALHGNTGMFSDDGVEWLSALVPVSSGNNWAIAWSRPLGLLVALGETGSERLMTSVDGVTWTRRENALMDADAWQFVAWSDDLGLFVATNGLSDSASPLATSPDGLTWTAGSFSGMTGRLGNFAYSPQMGLGVIASYFGSDEFMTTPDGTSQTTRPAEVLHNGAWLVRWVPSLGRFYGFDLIGSAPLGVIRSNSATA